MATRVTPECKCGSPTVLEHDGAGYVLRCVLAGHRRYDWIGKPKTITSALKTKASVAEKREYEKGPQNTLIISLEEALAQPGKTHRNVQFEATVLCWRKSPRRISCLESKANGPDLFSLTGTVCAHIYKQYRTRYSGEKARYDANIQEIKLPWNLERVPFSDQQGLARSFHAKSQEITGLRISGHSVNATCFTWHLDAPILDPDNLPLRGS